MSSILLLLVSFSLGILMARTKRFPKSTGQALGGYVIYVPLPALALLHIHNLELSHELVFPAIMPWIVFGLGTVLFYTLYRLKKIDRLTAGCLLLTAGLGNTSFVGLPMIEALYGKEALGIGILIDLAGSFLMLSTFGLLFATLLSDSKPNSDQEVSHIKEISFRILSFPPFIALLLSLLLRPIQYSDWFTQLLQQLGSTLTPVALAAVGFQLKLSNMKSVVKPLSYGLLYKLIFAPIFISILYLPFVADPLVYRVTVIESAMGPMVTGGIIAIEFGLNRELTSLMLAVGITLSFITVPIVWLLI